MCRRTKINKLHQQRHTMPNTNKFSCHCTLVFRSIGKQNHQADGKIRFFALAFYLTNRSNLDKVCVFSASLKPTIVPKIIYLLFKLNSDLQNLYYEMFMKKCLDLIAQ